MPEAQAPSPPPAPRTPEGNASAPRPAHPFLQALRRHPVRVALLALFLLALLFHRPLLNTALASFLRIAAHRAGFSLSLSLHGNPFGHCVLEHFQLHPSPPAPLPSLSIGRFELRYSLGRLLWSGPGECIRQISAQDIFLQLPPPSTSPPTPPAPSPPFLELLQNLLAKPALYTDALHLQNFNLQSSGASPLHSLQHLDFSAFPDRAGSLRLASLTLANGTRFENWQAQTAYPQRHLQLRNLALAPGLTLASFEFDASQRSHGQSRITTHLQLDSGSLQLSASAQNPTPASASPLLRIEFAAHQFPLARAAQIAGFPTPGLPEIHWAESHLQGIANAPASWTGQADLQASFPLPGPMAPAVLELHAAFHKATLEVDSLSAYSGSSSASASGEISLPRSLQTLTTTSGSLALHAQSEDLSELAPLLGLESPSGSAQITGSVAFQSGAAIASLQLRADAPGASPIHFSAALAELHAEVPLTLPLLPQRFTGHLTLSLQAPSLQTPALAARFESIEAAASLRNGTVSLERLHFQQGPNHASASASFTPWPSSQPPSGPLSQNRGRLTLECPELAQFGLQLLGQPIAGKCSASLDVSLPWRSATGTLQLHAAPLSWGRFQIATLHLDSRLDSGQLLIPALLLTLPAPPQKNGPPPPLPPKDPKPDSLRASGSLQTSPPYSFQGEAEARFSELHPFTALAHQLHSPGTLSGALDASWKGQGTLTPLSGSGTWQFLLKKARWNEIEIQELSGAGLYQPGLFQTQSLRFASSHTRLRSQIEWSNATLKIREIALEQWGYPTLSGFLNLPFDWNDSGPYWSPKGRILGQLHADHLDLATLFNAAGFPNPPPATGWLRFGLSLAGSPEAPEADFELAARELRTPSRPKLPASELDIQGHYRTDRLESSATLRSCLQAPLRLESRLSFDFGDLLFGKISPLQIPAETSLRIQKANLQSLPLLLPGLKKTEGSLSLELTSSGSLANPSWQGSLTLDAPVIHFVSYRFPALTELHLALALENRSLLVRKLNADLGGGKLEVSGSVAFPENTEPELQLRAKAHEVLVVRSRDLLLRLNGDLTASGPWSNAVLSGKASPSKSRLLIQMDLLPTNLLKRSSLRLPKTNSNSPWFTFPKPPFSEWKFNVALQTLPEDPFLLRGNILNGSAHADLTLKGSGAAPTLDGSYKTSDLAIRMPLAQISVSSGALWYYPDQPFRPYLDCSGETEVRNHRIQIYLSGPLDAPVPSLRSDPPLGNNELLSLVLTGSLPSDSAENNQAIAGRAAAVLFRELSGKVVDPAEARERLSALRRFSLDLGSLNTRTGQQETKLTYRIRDNLLIIGELGTNGDFGGQIKYLLRFR